MLLHQIFLCIRNASLCHPGCAVAYASSHRGYAQTHTDSDQTILYCHLPSFLVVVVVSLCLALYSSHDEVSMSIACSYSVSSWFAVFQRNYFPAKYIDTVGDRYIYVLLLWDVSTLCI